MAKQSYSLEGKIRRYLEVQHGLTSAEVTDADVQAVQGVVTRPRLDDLALAIKGRQEQS